MKRNKRRCSAPLYSVAGPSSSLSLKLSMIVLKGEGVESSESRERTTREGASASKTCVNSVSPLP